MRTRTLFSTACVLLALAMPVLAQPGPGGPPGGPGGGPGGPGGGRPGGGPQRGGDPMFGGGFGLLTTNAEVKAAVGLSDEQVKKIEDLQREFRESASPPGNFGQMTEEERTKAFEAMRKRMDEHQEKIKAVLTEEQLKKFNVARFQISGGLEARGPQLFQSLDALGLTAAQKAKMEEISKEMGEKMRSVFPPPGEGERPSREEMQKKMSELDAEIKSKISGVLTEEQKKLAAQLTEEGKELRDSVRQSFRDRREGGRQRGGEGEYRPGRDSWRPGQGAGNRSEDRPRQGNRRGFPRTQSE